MRNWQGIRQDTAVTADDGASFVTNPSYYTDGEIARRPGMSSFAEQSGDVILPFWCPTGGYQVAFATDTGSIVVLEASP